MSDWTKQTEELVTTWSNTQKQMWDNWLGAMESMSGDANLQTFETERKKVVDTWEASVKKGLEAQAEWAKLWADNLKATKGTPKPMVDWAKQMQGMMKSWTDSQEELSKVWFEMVRKMDMTEMSDNMGDQSKQVVGAWQDAVDKSLEAQKNMTEFWSQAAMMQKKA